MKLIRRIYLQLLKILPTKFVINIENLLTYGKWLNEKNPKYFGEKIQCLKLSGKLEKYSKYADKYKVREYVEKKIGKQYLIPLLGVYDKSQDINYSELPNKFVLKLNHGSAYNIIVKNKDKANIKKINNQLEKWLKEDYSKIKKENQYKNIDRKIICEQYISDKNDELLDYKFFCFDGKPEFVKIDFDRFSNHTMNYYDLNWNLLEIKEGKYQNYNGNVKKPENFQEMIDIVTKLSSEFQFVRVDIYNVDGKIYFGELTFTPASGKNKFTPLEEDHKIAERIKI